MGVVQGPDGRFYEIPDEELNRYAVPDEKVKEVLRGPDPGAPAANGNGAPMPPGPPPPGMPPGMPPGGPVVIQIFTSGPGMGAPGEPEAVAQGWGAWQQQQYRPVQQYVWPWGWPGYQYPPTPPPGYPGHPGHPDSAHPGASGPGSPGSGGGPPA